MTFAQRPEKQNAEFVALLTETKKDLHEFQALLERYVQEIKEDLVSIATMPKSNRDEADGPDLKAALNAARRRVKVGGRAKVRGRRK